MPWQEAQSLEEGSWTEIPGTFLPRTILDLCFGRIPEPPPQILKLIALLALVTPQQVEQYY